MELLLVMFWDGTQWIREGEPRRRIKPSASPWTAWIATGLMLVILVGIALPLRQAEAEGAQLTLSPNAAVPGATVTARVEGAPQGSTVQLRWDGDPITDPIQMPGRQGKANIRFVVPGDEVGTHQISLVTAPPPAAKNRTKPSPAAAALAPGILLASAAFSLVAPAAPTTAPAPSDPPVSMTAQPTALPSAPGSTPGTTSSATPSPTPTVAPSTPAPTPHTTPVPVVATPVPTPTPPPAPPPPSTSCVVTFGGDASGRSDVTSQLSAFLSATPAGATACLAPGGQYRVDGTVHLARRESGITIDGHGARLFATTRRDRPMLLIDEGGRNIVVRNLTLEGLNPNGRTSNAHELAWEHGHGLVLGGVIGVTISNVAILNMNGDGIYITGGWVGSTFRWTEAARISGIVIDGTGRNGIAWTDGARNVVVSGSVVRNTGLYAFDIEPNANVFAGVTAGVDGITITGNTISRYTIDTDWGPYLFAATGHGPERNVEFSNNVVVGQELRITVQPNGYERTNIRILNNRSDRRVAGPVITAAGCNGLTISGNVQPLSGGALASVSGCSNVTITNNNTN